MDKKLALEDVEDVAQPALPLEHLAQFDFPWKHTAFPWHDVVPSFQLQRPNSSCPSFVGPH
jgi:hypothetical protein